MLTFLYGWTLLGALTLSFLLTPAARAAAMVLNIYDHPYTRVKTHREPVPYLGGVAIYLAFMLTLLWIRLLTGFPTGTLRALRGIFMGGTLIFAVGLIDDIKHHGLHYRTKFLFQILAAVTLILFDVHIHFIRPEWLAHLLTIVWVVGVTNAFNLIDIMDGLAGGVAATCALSFLLISLPTEDIYVNVAAAALLGASVGFLPFNLSKRWRLFMGDCGSLFLGFVSSALALGTSYGGNSPITVVAPLIILSVPIYDTLLVFYLRIRKGISPFLGSKDHFALRLEILGWKRPSIVLAAVLSSLLLSVLAWCLTLVNESVGVLICVTVGLFIFAVSWYVVKARVE